MFKLHELQRTFCFWKEEKTIINDLLPLKANPKEIRNQRVRG